MNGRSLSESASYLAVSQIVPNRLSNFAVWDFCPEQTPHCGLRNSLWFLRFARACRLEQRIGHWWSYPNTVTVAPKTRLFGHSPPRGPNPGNGGGKIPPGNGGAGGKPATPGNGGGRGVDVAAGNGGGSGAAVAPGNGGASGITAQGNGGGNGITATPGNDGGRCKAAAPGNGGGSGID